MVLLTRLTSLQKSSQSRGHIRDAELRGQVDQFVVSSVVSCVQCVEPVLDAAVSASRQPPRQEASSSTYNGAAPLQPRADLTASSSFHVVADLPGSQIGIRPQQLYQAEESLASLVTLNGIPSDATMRDEL
ncbi:hypothetical protein NLG97_g10631 [Lecanicillium saksenae]|uniref:Uncharacterized protein n=1 Tax=Lecanicillium saksenae TaxID=468837 RepID=A0ACC1QGG8_9HYPO|nr:hypothetical protein NLG97_g10631 [Lecanicillium saksenae]